MLKERATVVSGGKKKPLCSLNQMFRVSDKMTGEGCKWLSKISVGPGGLADTNVLILWCS